MHKIKIGDIFIILMWLCWLAAIIVNIFSNTAFWILMGCWLVFALASLINSFLVLRDIRKKTRELKECEKYLKELIKGYLTVSLEIEKENKED